MNFSGTVVDFMTPTPQTEELPALVERYQEAPWRREDMTLLEFARKSNSEGEIVRYLQEDHKRSCMEEVRRQRGLGDKEFRKGGAPSSSPTSGVGSRKPRPQATIQTLSRTSYRSKASRT